jgi:hypothetical protein
VLVSLDGRRMIAVFSEYAVASFALIIFLATTASDQRHRIGDNLWTGVSNHKVKWLHVVRIKGKGCNENSFSYGASSLILQPSAWRV